MRVKLHYQSVVCENLSVLISTTSRRIEQSLLATMVNLTTRELDPTERLAILMRPGQRD